MKLIFDDDGDTRHIIEVCEDKIRIYEEYLYEGSWSPYHDYGASISKKELKKLIETEEFKKWLNA